LKCLLAADHGRIHLQFGHRGCFGGSDNDLDLDVASTSTLSGHLWTGPSTNRATEGVVLTREQGQAYLRLLVDALVKKDEPSAGWTTTKAFVRASYWCGTQKSGPFMAVTEAPGDDEEERAFEGMMSRKPAQAAPHRPYSRVHGTIAVARNILASVPSKDVNSLEQLESARRQRASLYENGIRVRHDPVEHWKDP
jgi:hypothetical protein